MKGSQTVGARFAKSLAGGLELVIGCWPELYDSLSGNNKALASENVRLQIWSAPQRRQWFCLLNLLLKVEQVRQGCLAPRKYDRK
jgi:hypothetical protein